MVLTILPIFTFGACFTLCIVVYHHMHARGSIPKLANGELGEGGREGERQGGDALHCMMRASPL
jgi:hypothetical protein